MEEQKKQWSYEFAGFRLDLRKKRLLRGDDIVALTPKEFEVLLLLIENAGRIVEKEDLLKRIWTDVNVEEGTLTRNVSWLRKKLAAHVSVDLRIIETLPKIGYRLVSPVTRYETSDHLDSVKDNSSKAAGQIDVWENSSLNTPPGSESPVTEPVSELSSAVINKQLKKRLSTIWIFSAAAIVLLLGSFIWYQSFSRKSPELIIASKIVPFSGLPGRETAPAFSPDGKQLVYSWDGGIENGNSNIYLKNIGSGEPVRLTKSLANEISPIFSPDGASIAFVRVLPAGNEIISIPAAGGAETVIYKNASYASISFSPDGKYLALANLDFSQNEAGIFLFDLQTGARTRLTVPEAPAVDHTPRFSPDGKSLAFIRYFNSFRREVFTVPVSGGAEHQITFDEMRIYGLAWGSDSRKLFFTSYRKFSQLNLWELSALGDSSEEPKLIPTGSKNLESVAISPDGRTAAFVEEAADENIWEITSNSAYPLIRSTRADHSQQFSPDGKQIVFASDRTGEYEIWLADADGKNQRQLTFSKGSAGSARFSPDGKSIVYDVQTAGMSDIFIISVNGGEPHRLTNDDKNNFIPAWSTDGQQIFFLSNRSGSDQLWKIPVNGGEAVQLTKQGAFEMFAAPDGKHLIYAKGGGKIGLWQVGIDGSDEKPLPELTDAGGWRSWTVTASGVYYTAQATQPPYQIKFFDFNSRQTSLIEKIEKPPLTYYSNLSVSPDGKRILYAGQDQSSDTILLAEFETP